MDILLFMWKNTCNLKMFNIFIKIYRDDKNTTLKD